PFHYGGDILIWNNQLYATTGDHYNSDLAQNPNSAASCIFRINLDGSIPADNNTPKKEKACWAWGVRNGTNFFYHINMIGLKVLCLFVHTANGRLILSLVYSIISSPSYSLMSRLA